MLFRRGFLKRLSMGVPLALALPAQAQNLLSNSMEESNYPSPMQKAGKTIGLAILGLGKYGTEQIMPNIKDCKHVRLTGLISGDKEKAERLADQYGVEKKNIYNYSNMAQIANNPDIDAVYIITPNGTHKDFALKVAEAKKHVLVEKPMATTVADCQAMISACQKAGVKLMVGYRCHFEPFNLAAMEAVGKGKIGDVRMFTSEHGRQVKPNEEKADKWRVDKKLAGGGSLMDIGIYALQAACYMTGEEPAWVTATFNKTSDPRFTEVEDICAFTLHFPSGVVGQCISGYSFQEVKRFRVFGAKAWLDLDPATDYYEHKLVIGYEDREEKPNILEGNQFAAQMDHFAQAILEGKNIRTGGDMGLRDVKIMLAIYESARKNGARVDV